MIGVVDAGGQWTGLVSLSPGKGRGDALSQAQHNSSRAICCGLGDDSFSYSRLVPVHRQQLGATRFAAAIRTCPISFHTGVILSLFSLSGQWGIYPNKPQDLLRAILPYPALFCEPATNRSSLSPKSHQQSRLTASFESCVRINIVKKYISSKRAELYPRCLYTFIYAKYAQQKKSNKKIQTLYSHPHFPLPSHSHILAAASWPFLPSLTTPSCTQLASSVPSLAKIFCSTNPLPSPLQGLCISLSIHSSAFTRFGS